jgi:ABC-type sugar transport system ATPase subunit
LDEPTAALSIEETNSLFEILKKLKDKGVTILYISHRLEEIYKIAEKVSVLRNGKLVYSGPISKVDINELISLMIGRKVTNKYPEKPNKNIGEIIFKVDNLTSESFKNISFLLHKGEILGITGLVGCGSTQLGEAIFGLSKFYSGNIYYKGEKFYPKKPEDSISKDICYIPGDRQSLGLVLRRSIVENHTLPNMDKFAKKGFLNIRKERKSALSTVKQLNIKVHNIKEKAEKLSGGNQQKLVIGKWLIRQPKLLIMDEPTRGVDVGAKYEIYKKIYELSSQGVSILLISTDIDEVYNLCDRILVMSEGRITKSVYPNESSKEEILLFAVQGKEKVSITL